MNFTEQTINGRRIHRRFFLAQTRFAFEDGEIVPWWLGLAWYDYPRNARIMVLIPFNVIIGASRRAYLWLRNPWGMKARTVGEQACFDQGVEHGREVEKILRHSLEVKA